MARLNPFRRHMLILRFDAGSLLEAFLVSAVTALLVVRFALVVAGYPTLGGATCTSPTCCGAASA